MADRQAAPECLGLKTQYPPGPQIHSCEPRRRMSAGLWKSQATNRNAKEIPMGKGNNAQQKNVKKPKKSKADKKKK